MYFVVFSPNSLPRGGGEKYLFFFFFFYGFEGELVSGIFPTSGLFFWPALPAPCWSCMLTSVPRKFFVFLLALCYSFLHAGAAYPCSAPLAQKTAGYLTPPDLSRISPFFVQKSRQAPSPPPSPLRFCAESRPFPPLIFSFRSKNIGFRRLRSRRATPPVWLTPFFNWPTRPSDLLSSLIVLIAQPCRFLFSLSIP